MKDIATLQDVQAQIIEAFTFRHACKLFDAERKVPDDQFDTILEAARLSPTSFGHEPFQILMIQNPDKRELFRDFAWGANGSMHGTSGQLGTASHFGIILAHTSETMTAGSPYLQSFYRDVKLLPEEVIELFNGAYGKFQAEDFDIHGDRQITDWSARQAYIVLANMMTAGALMGIDSCPIEGFEIARTQDVLQEHFGVDPKAYRPAVMFAFGYRAAEPAFGKTRRETDKMVQWF
ncbi:NAD(P)H-dependent oxidoreductase [Shimia sp. CNT1-13L.2]|uniref:NAD(P)H-dependent oxidoreductase n=1 Tax=Shimia sp. CNT1-13L.2 TaxID=2959663 RepID=UPI0020CC12AE|nr:NAD(P)H-dependent oxidoreductase [Shimia sp. CNT1-13L.2]MCP9481723.1 NAD(P)H-dependent oxidoreductase [Shimia sp. CNT1-13L.2]